MAIHRFSSPHSANIHSATYDEDARKLTVHFKNSAGDHSSTFDYPEFSIVEWRRFQDAKSKGSHFAQHIRKQFRGLKTWAK